MPDFELSTILTFMAASLALNLTPGPDLMFISATGAAAGSRAGIAAGLGVVAGTLWHTALAVAGAAALFAAYPAAFDALRYAGAAYLLWLAWTAWHADPAKAAGKGAASAGKAFLRGLLTNMANPKVFVFVMAFLPQFADPARGPVWLQILLLGLLFGIGSVPVNCGAGALAGLFARWLKQAGGMLNKTAALVYGALAARLAVA